MSPRSDARGQRARGTGPAAHGDGEVRRLRRGPPAPHPPPRPAPTGPLQRSGPGQRRGRVPRWLSDVALGARLVAAGGRDGWLRAGLTALGVGLGVALLLLAASVPAIQRAPDDRDQARLPSSYQEVPADDTLLINGIGMEYRGQGITGVLVQPEGPDAPIPPGVAELPEPGELVVSPALGRLLAAGDGDLLRPRLDYPIAGTIGKEGLRGPQELYYYLGTTVLAGTESPIRIDHFGEEQAETQPPDPLLTLLIIVGIVVLLVPVATFIAVAVRFGGEHRDRRLAALRLVGADAAMTRRIAAGEALVAAALGLVAGAGLFLVGRQLVERVTVFDLTAFATDVRPNAALAGLVLAAVPVLAVAATMLAMRSLVAEPLGVVRRASGVRRQLWWRLAAPAAGVMLLLLLISRGNVTGDALGRTQLVVGVLLVLLGVAALLPWLVDTVVRRMRGRGRVSWQLAIRRLQLSGSVGRVACGVAVAAAGAIALHMLFTATQGDFTTVDAAAPDNPPTLADLDGDVDGDRAEAVTARFAATTGVRSASAVRVVTATDPDRGVSEDSPGYTVAIGGCPALAKLAAIDRCADGNAFVVTNPSGGRVPVDPGQEIQFGFEEDPAGAGVQEWTVPARALSVPASPDPYTYGSTQPQVLVTPGAVAGIPVRASQLRLSLELDPANPDAVEHARNTAAAIDVRMRVTQYLSVREDDRFASIRRSLLGGVTATLLLIGLSLLVGTVEQLRERRRLLAVLIAFGTRRRTLGWSVLWQTAIPVVLGMLLAVVAGIGLGLILLAMASYPPSIDGPMIAAITGIAAGVVLLVTLLAMPVLWRLMRPDGLRTE